MDIYIAYTIDNTVDSIVIGKLSYPKSKYNLLRQHLLLPFLI